MLLVFAQKQSKNLVANYGHLENRTFHQAMRSRL